jgi:hypothetical protein
MVRYFYAWTPLVAVGTVTILTLPWLGLIALMLVALVALPTLAFAIVGVPYVLIRAIVRGLHGRNVARPRTTPLLSPATRHPTLQKGYVS